MLCFRVTFGETASSFVASFGKVQVVTTGAAPYEGDYVVTPAVEAQTLKTKDKLMADDVSVKAIPYAEVKNMANGITVTIAD